MSTKPNQVSHNHREIFIRLDSLYHDNVANGVADPTARSIAIHSTAMAYCKQFAELVISGGSNLTPERDLINSLSEPDEPSILERAESCFLASIQISLLPSFKEFLTRYWHPTPPPEANNAA